MSSREDVYKRQVWEEALLVENTVPMVIQVNGRLRDKLEVPRDISREELELSLIHISFFIPVPPEQKQVCRYFHLLPILKKENGKIAFLSGTVFPGRGNFLR